MKGKRAMAKLIARARPVLLAVLAIAVAVAFATWRSNSAHAEEGAPRLAPTDISDAVLFNDGPAAGFLVDLNRGPTPWTGEMREVQREINDSIMADPAMAQGFAEQMQSGDPRQVEEAFNSLAITVRRVLDRRYGPDTVDKAMVDLDRQFIDDKLIRIAVLHNEFAFDNGHDVWFALDAVVAAEVVAVAVAAVALAAVWVVTIKFDDEFSERAKLAHEILIVKIAGGLRVRFQR
jgi:hypothetical protein